MIEILLLLFSDFKLISLWKRNEIHFCCLMFEIRYFNELIKAASPLNRKILS